MKFTRWDDTALSSWIYLLFFLPLLYVVYVAVPKRHRWAVLLAASCAFCWLVSRWLVAYVLAAAFVAWASALLVDRARDKGKKGRQPGETRGERKARKALTKRRMKAACAAGVCILLGTLVVVKYGAFLISAIDGAAGALGVGAPLAVPEAMALPLGISFYTLAAVSYVVDVYRGKYAACRSLGTVALFVAYFPALTEGPIGRFDQLAGQLRAGEPARGERRAYGVQLILWGLVKKIVVADRLAPLVNELYDHHASYSGLMVVLAAVLYTLQLYADFSGVVDIARGSSELFGVTLARNFEQPFFSRSVNEFWRRWHMSLGSWLRDYVFYPVSLSGATRRLSVWARRRFSGRASQLIPATLALLAVWSATGIWHGAAWKYLAYGLYYFCIVMVGTLLEPAIRSFFAWSGIDRGGRFARTVSLARTLVLVCVGMMLFRADTLGAFRAMLRSVWVWPGTEPLTSGSVFAHGADRYDLLVVAVFAALMLAVDVAHERGVAFRPLLLGHGTAVCWASGFALLACAIVFGAYGVSYVPVPSIYAKF